MFPAVATVYGLRVDEGVNSQFVATLAIDQPLSSSACTTHTVVKTEEKPAVHEILSSMQVSDPVTQAVIDNVAGKLPLKNKFVRCEVCNLSLSGQSVYGTHINGVKHKKKLALAGLEQSVASSKSVSVEEQPVASSESDGVKEKVSVPVKVHCSLCNKWTDTAEQLKIHEGGKLHKRKLAASAVTASNGTKTAKNSIGPEAPLPEYVETSQVGAATIFTCTLCNKCNNSLEQLNIHLRARPHSNKIKGVFGGRHAPYEKKMSLARATFRSFRSGGVLGHERPPRQMGNRQTDSVSFPNYTAVPGQYGFSEKPMGYPKRNRCPGDYNTNSSNYNNRQTYASYGQTSSNGQTSNYGQVSSNGQASSNQQTSNYGQGSRYGQTSNYGQTSSYGQYSRYEQPSSNYGNTNSSYGYTTGNQNSNSGQYGNSVQQYGNAGNARGGKTPLFANKKQEFFYNQDKITPSKAKHYFNNSINQMPFYQTQSFQYMPLMDM